MGPITVMQMLSKTNARWIVASVCFLAMAATAWCQKADFQGPGQQKIVLPLAMVAAQPATLAVLTADGRIAPGVKLILSSGEEVTTDESGRAHFLAPPETGIMFARISGTEVREAVDVLPRGSGNGYLEMRELPKLVSLDDRFPISGDGFQGDADQNRVTIDGKRILVLASSPVQLIAMAPANAQPGPVNITVVEGTTEAATPVTLVDVVSSTSSSEMIQRGKKIPVILRVRGSAEPVDLEVRNLSPQTVQFLHGNVESVGTSGGPDNTAVLQVKGINAGQFSFAVSLENRWTIAGAPVAGDFLQAAQEYAQPDLAHPVAVTLRELRSGDVNLARLRSDLQEISNRGSSQDFQALIRAARRALAGE